MLRPAFCFREFYWIDQLSGKRKSKEKSVCIGENLDIFMTCIVMIDYCLKISGHLSLLMIILFITDDTIFKLHVQLYYRFFVSLVLAL